MLVKTCLIEDDIPGGLMIVLDYHLIVTGISIIRAVDNELLCYRIQNKESCSEAVLWS